VSPTSILPKPFSKLGRSVVLALAAVQGLLSATLSASQPHKSELTVPQISYVANGANGANGADRTTERALIFMNNPEFLWASNHVCDLADETHPFGRDTCRTSLFRIEALRQGQYRAWWEHRNMMPFAIRSGILLSNPGAETAIIDIVGLALESNSIKRGGLEFVEMFNAPKTTQRLTIMPGERIMLDKVSTKWIHPSHFFAGVVDFDVLEGSVSLDEIVFRKQPSPQLNALGYSQRKLWGVHESLVYKGISQTSAVVLKGADFQIDDTTPLGALPVSYRLSEPQGDNHTSGACNPELSPPCTGRALSKHNEPTQQNSWVSHIAPDPRDANPKRTRAIVDDLIELVVPASTPSCPSGWPMHKNLAERSCMRMSAQFHWFLEDFNHWRLPNWGNWAVQYSHPIRVTNTGTQNRTVVLKVTADGASPLAYRGSGVSTVWKQVFLDPRAKNGKLSSVILAKGSVAPGTTLELQGEFILSGPGAGTLEHQFEIIE